jgi:hypothetical protein
VDLLAVQEDGFSRRRETVRLQEALSPLRIPADVLVVSHEEAAQPKGAGDAVGRSPKESCCTSRPDTSRARVFLERADGDLAAVRIMEAAREVPDEVVGLAPLADLHAVVDLYPFGVQLRYESPAGDEPLDRAAMRTLLERLRAWADAALA